MVMLTILDVLEIKRSLQGCDTGYDQSVVCTSVHSLIRDRSMWVEKFLLSANKRFTISYFNSRELPFSGELISFFLLICSCRRRHHQRRRKHVDALAPDRKQRRWRTKPVKLKEHHRHLDATGACTEKQGDVEDHQEN